jgi:hypothetical protein
MLSPYFGAGGSSASQGSWRNELDGSQFTEASMLRPMISKAMKPKNSEDRVPRPAQIDGADLRIADLAAQ